jgi:hypothetical protein
MKLYKLLLSVSMLVNLTSFAQAADPTDADKYTMFCGSRTQLIEYFKNQGEDISKITDKDFVELNQSRLPFLKIVELGQKGIEDLLEEGSNTDTGPFGAIIACGMLLEIKTEVLKNGCHNLETNKSVFSSDNLVACQDFMKKVSNGNN